MELLRLNTRRHEHELGEIKALTAELVDRFERIQEDLERIGEAQEKRLAALAPGGTRSANDERDTPPLIAFVHIPKTAGGTAKDMLARAYSRAAVHNAGNYVTGQEKSAAKIARRPGGWERWIGKGGRVTAGHVPLGLFHEHLPANTRYITLLRAPVDRVLSHYDNHVARTGTASDRWRQERGVALADSIEEALIEMRLPQLSNLATRFLCGHPSPLGELPPSALDDAKANLRKFAFVGIQERFEESVVLLQRMLGLELVPYLDRHVSIDRPSAEDISGDRRALIKEHNRLDIELYSFGRRLLDDAVATADEGFAGDVETLRASSAKTNEEALEAARDWLDRRLPAGTTESDVTLRVAAKAAGVSIAALKQVSMRLAVETWLDDDLQRFWTRADPEAHEPSPADHHVGPASVVTRQDGVSTLVVR